MSKNWQISRRQMLRGIGAAIALPALDCMAGIPEPSKPKRSVFLYIPNGVNTLTWQIEKAGADYQLTKPLQSLERHRADVTPISGLHHPLVLGKHHNCEKVWLTGANVPGDGGAFRNTVSADQLIAETIGAATRFPSLEMAIEGPSLAWSKDGIQIPDDRSKLDEYLTAVRQVEERTRRADEWLNVPKPVVPAADAARLQRKLSMAEAGAYYRLFYDLMVMALRTDSTRVITCGIGGEGNASGIPDIGILQARHGLSHHNGDPEQLRRLTQTDTFLIDQFSYFLDQLKEHKEEDQTLLDTTQVLGGSGMAYCHRHGNANLPTILAGGKALGYSHGTHVDFNLPKIGKYDVSNATEHYKICSRPVDGDARVSNLLLTMLQRVDVKADKFQDSVKPISQIV